MINKSFKEQELHWVLMVAKMMLKIAGEVDQTANDENKEFVKIKIVKEEINNSIDDNFSIILEESDNEEEEKECII